MTELLIIADDFTGALDTAVAFSCKGFRTQVHASADIDFSQVDPDIKVLAVNAGSRHLSASDAYSTVKRITEEAKAYDIRKIYKKTDSVLRGNIGAELTAVMDAFEENLYFLPAYPALQRVTVEGIHYCDGVRLEESFLGKDAFERVRSSRIKDIIEFQSDVHVEEMKADSRISCYSDEKILYVIDSATKKDMEIASENIRKHCGESDIMLMAGCAGLAEYVCGFLDIDTKHVMKAVGHSDKLLIVSGSLNAVSKEQMKTIKDSGFPYHAVDAAELSQTDLRRLATRFRHELQENRMLIIETSGTMDSIREKYPDKKVLDEKRKAASDALAFLTECLLKEEHDYALMVIGGDTLETIVKRLYSGDLEPVGNICTYGVESYVETFDGRRIRIITKSGGFGKKNTVLEICGAVLENGNSSEEAEQWKEQ